VGRGGGRRVETLETIKQQAEWAASRAAVRVCDPRRGRVSVRGLNGWPGASKRAQRSKRQRGTTPTTLPQRTRRGSTGCRRAGSCSAAMGSRCPPQGERRSPRKNPPSPAARQTQDARSLPGTSSRTLPHPRSPSCLAAADADSSDFCFGSTGTASSSAVSMAAWATKQKPRGSRFTPILSLGFGRFRSCAAAQIRLDPDECFVAIAIARRSPAAEAKRSSWSSTPRDCSLSKGIVALWRRSTAEVEGW
jgi:hypothetical protein